MKKKSMKPPTISSFKNFISFFSCSFDPKQTRFFPGKRERKKGSVFKKRESSVNKVSHFYLNGGKGRRIKKILSHFFRVCTIIRIFHFFPLSTSLFFPAEEESIAVSFRLNFVAAFKTPSINF